MNAFKAFLIGAGVAAVLSAGPAACAAQAATHHHPSERARIHALEKEVKHLKILLDQNSAVVDRVDASQECLGVLASDIFMLPGTDPGQAALTLMLGPTGERPSYWLAVIDDSCVTDDPQPRMAR